MKKLSVFTRLAAAGLAAAVIGNSAIVAHAAAVKEIYSGPNIKVYSVSSEDCGEDAKSLLERICGILSFGKPGSGKPDNGTPETGVDKPDNVTPETGTDKPETSLPENVTPEIGGDKPETSLPDNVAPETGAPETLSYAEQVVKLVNEERAKAGLAALALDESIASAAQVRAREIEVSFSHTRPDGRSFSTVLKDNGISYRGAGENIAWGQKSPEEVMKGWMNSEGHRANILNPKFTKIGVGCYQNAAGRNYWTQLFTY